MATVVFFRAVNVGGHQKFQPSMLAKKLAGLGVLNIGAAGTMIVREPVRPSELRAAILGHLEFEPELMICPAAELIALVRAEPFRGAPAGDNIKPFVSVMHTAPRHLPKLPLDAPEDGSWEVRVVGVSGRFALSVRRPQGRAIVYPNSVVEKHLKVSATTRSWNTIGTICNVLEN